MAEEGTPLTNSNASTDRINHYLIDQISGFKVPVSEGLQKDGYGLYTNKGEGRHPQEFVRSRPEQQKGSKSPESEDRFIEDLYAIGYVQPSDL